MISLQRKFLLFLLLCVCAPLYVLIRFFYGRSFFWLVFLALIVNLATPLVLMAMLGDHRGLPGIERLYDPAVSWELSIAALLYVLPLHLGWLVFYGLSRDGRYDLDHPGRSPIPFIHPWLADIGLALLLAFWLWRYGGIGPWVPYYFPWLPFPHPAITIPSSTLLPACVMVVAFIAAVMISTPAPRLRFRGRARSTADRPVAFGMATIAKMPEFRAGSMEEIMARRGPEYAELVSGMNPPEGRK